jgi:hypothetical protein
VEMRVQGITEPCGPDLLDSFDIPSFGFVDEARIVQDAIVKLRASGRSWVKVKDLVKVVLESGLETSPQRLGRQLGANGLGLPVRRNPDAEYNVSAARTKK